MENIFIAIIIIALLFLLIKVAGSRIENKHEQWLKNDFAKEIVIGEKIVIPEKLDLLFEKRKTSGRKEIPDVVRYLRSDKGRYIHYAAWLLINEYPYSEVRVIDEMEVREDIARYNKERYVELFGEMKSI